MAASSSDSSKSKPPWKYHVFLSFRGKDTRNNFTDHLYAALCRKGILTFRDDEEIERGEVIEKELPKAIEESLAAIVILSQNYASSSWCLDELQKILEARRKSGTVVLPVFYGIDPSNVRHQSGSFAEAFKKHEERFGENKEKVQRWREILSEVADLSGFDSKNESEAQFIEEIIAVLWRRLEPNLPSYNNDGLVGIETRLTDMYQILDTGSRDVRFVGIWGMGGLGKTTLAKLVFKKIHRQFDISCTLENIRELSSQRDGLLGLQRKLLSHLKIGSMRVEYLDQGMETIRNLLFRRKVLLVLDDVNNISQLEYLAGNLDWFGLGSRIIVTTRDMHLLESHAVDFYRYELKLLNTNESFYLFFRKAFKGKEPEKGYLELSKAVVQYAGGLPLALEVLGPFLCRRALYEWEDVLDKIRKIPPNDILSTLKISYDGLQDHEKAIFLDIACFFKGWKEYEVAQILKNCGFYPTIGIKVLIERSLLTCKNGVLLMHDLLQEMGKNIVVQESVDTSKRSRLCSPKDIDKVLRGNKGTECIQGIVLRSYNNEAHCCHEDLVLEPHIYEAYWDREAFSKMSNLRVLIILQDLQLPLGLYCLSNSLKVLQWNKYPLKSLPPGVQLDELIDLKMCESKITQLWSGPQTFENLKFIDLSHSSDLIQTPIISRVPYLESLILEGCSNLVAVDQSVGWHKKLVVLNLKDCINLKYLPSKFEMNSLECFILSGCSKVRKLPEFGEDMECVSVLDLKDCKSLGCLPSSISNLKSLKTLDISGCSKFSRLPENMNENEALEILDLSQTAIRDVPSSIGQLENLKRLSFCECRGQTLNIAYLSPLGGSLGGIQLQWA